MHASTAVWRRASLPVLLFVCGILTPPLASARPVVLEEVARLTSPDPALDITGAVALDGNDLLVVASEPLDGTEGQRQCCTISSAAPMVHGCCAVRFSQLRTMKLDAET